MSNQSPSDKKAAITIARTSGDMECIRLQVRIGRELIDLDMGLADFSLALTGRGEVPAVFVRRINR